jgi:hypothetical protein
MFGTPVCSLIITEFLNFAHRIVFIKEPNVSETGYISVLRWKVYAYFLLFPALFSYLFSFLPVFRCSAQLLDCQAQSDPLDAFCVLYCFPVTSMQTTFLGLGTPQSGRRVIGPLCIRNKL